MTTCRSAQLVVSHYRDSAAATTFLIGYRHGLCTASETDQTLLGLSQICLTSHANRLTIGGGVKS
jgi:hypothetical protein